jgi:hypothetical protein
VFDTWLPNEIRRSREILWEGYGVYIVEITIFDNYDDWDGYEFSYGFQDEIVAKENNSKECYDIDWFLIKYDISYVERWWCLLINTSLQWWKN